MAEPRPAGGTRRLTTVVIDIEPGTSSLGLLDRLQPALLVGAIGAGLGLAKIVPDFADSLLPLVSIGVFVLIYLAMLGVKLRGVLEAFADRRFLMTAVAINFVVNPLLAWVLGATFLQAEPDLWVGLILFLVTPCIGWYLIFTELAGGDTGMGVSLLGLNVILQILLLPIYLYAFAGRVVPIEIQSIAASVVTFLIGPLVAASISRWVIDRSGQTVEALERRLRLPYIKTTALVIVIVAMFASQAEQIFDNPGVFLKLLAPIGLFFVIAFVVAIVVGQKLRFPFSQVALLAFTTTSRNSEASLAIAATAFASPLVSLAVVIGPVIELPLLVVMVRVLLGIRERLEPSLTAR